MVSFLISILLIFKHNRANSQLVDERMFFKPVQFAHLLGFSAPHACVLFQSTYGTVQELFLHYCVQFDF